MTEQANAGEGIGAANDSTSTTPAITENIGADNAGGVVSEQAGAASEAQPGADAANVSQVTAADVAELPASANNPVGVAAVPGALEAQDPIGESAQGAVETHETILQEIEDHIKFFGEGIDHRFVAMVARLKEALAKL